MDFVGRLIISCVLAIMYCTTIGEESKIDRKGPKRMER